MHANCPFRSPAPGPLDFGLTVIPFFHYGRAAARKAKVVLSADRSYWSFDLISWYSHAFDEIPATIVIPVWAARTFSIFGTNLTSQHPFHHKALAE